MPSNLDYYDHTQVLNPYKLHAVCGWQGWCNCNSTKTNTEMLLPKVRSRVKFVTAKQGRKKQQHPGSVSFPWQTQRLLTAFPSGRQREKRNKMRHWKLVKYSQSRPPHCLVALWCRFKHFEIHSWTFVLLMFSRVENELKTQWTLCSSRSMALQHYINKGVIDQFALAVCFNQPAMKPSYTLGRSAHSPPSHLDISLVFTVHLSTKIPQRMFTSNIQSITWKGPGCTEKKQTSSYSSEPSTVCQWRWGGG